MTTMYDSVSPELIPADAAAVAGYADGRYLWSSGDWARFQQAIPLSVCCFPGSRADVLDIESGCAGPLDAPGWCDRFDRASRRAPTLYVNRGNWDAVRRAVGPRVVDYWVSTLDGTLYVPGAVAVQYWDTGAYDLSVVWDEWWLRGQWPQPAFDPAAADWWWCAAG